MKPIAIHSPATYHIVGRRAGITYAPSAPPLSTERVARLQSYIADDLTQVYRIDLDLMAEGFDDVCWIYATDDGGAWWMVRSTIAGDTVEDHSINRIFANVDSSGENCGQQNTPLLGVDSDGFLIASAIGLWPVDVTQPVAYLPARRHELAAHIRRLL